MSNQIIISIVLLKFGFISANYLEDEANYLKPKLERNNIVNKGVWIRNKFRDNLFEKTNLGDFIFRPNSVDVDNVLQNNFDAFGENYMQDTPFFSTYVERSKRSPNHIRKRRPRKSLKNCTNKSNCRTGPKNNIEDTSVLVETKLIPDLKPASVFNDYPYEVAILLNNNKIKINDLTVDVKANTTNLNETYISKDDKSTLGKKQANDFQTKLNNTKNNTSILKRSSKYDYESETIKKFEFIENINNTDDNVDRNKVDRGIFDKNDRVWHQNAPLPDINMYKVVPKDPEKNKPVTERGLIKVISMLTKTFKKIMKQHNEIKIIHSKLISLSDDFLKNVALVTSKFEDFDEKYSYLTKFNEKLKTFEENLAVKEDYFRKKQTEMAKNLVDFENQQKKFLNQQKQFYAMQRLLLTQNEKINIKQNMIAKTQSEISHRQNNFARILKKAKELYVDSKNSVVINKLHLNLAKNNTKVTDLKQVTHTTTFVPATESVKINLFAVPISNRIENHDERIMKEKDEQPIDDLVYKYYFNNTFIDNFMKNNILTSYVAAPESHEARNSAKNKRNESNTTTLIPVTKTNITKFVNKNSKREKRWISHHSRRNLKRKHHGKGEALIVNATDNKSIIKNKVQNHTETKMNKTDPFLNIATHFCKEIGQNTNTQILGWCVEKTLRKLQHMDMKLFAFPIPIGNAEKSNKIEETKQQAPKLDGTTAVTETSSAVPTTIAITSSYGVAADNLNNAMYAVGTDGAQNTVFFPDNDELESNLQQYDLKPDIEGNVYYDGSVHTSDMLLGDEDSDGGYSDIMPGLNSNSRVQMDPLAFDLQSRRRAYVKSINEDILKRMFKGIEG